MYLKEEYINKIIQENIDNFLLQEGFRKRLKKGLKKGWEGTKKIGRTLVSDDEEIGDNSNGGYQEEIDNKSEESNPNIINFDVNDNNAQNTSNNTLDHVFLANSAYQLQLNDDGRTILIDNNGNQLKTQEGYDVFWDRINDKPYIKTENGSSYVDENDLMGQQEQPQGEQQEQPQGEEQQEPQEQENTNDYLGVINKNEQYPISNALYRLAQNRKLRNSDRAFKIMSELEAIGL